MTTLFNRTPVQDGNEAAIRPAGTVSPAAGAAVRTMLEARSVALVGASARPGTFGSRMLEEVGKSSSRPRMYPVNPRYQDLAGNRCYPSLAGLPEAPELTLLAVPDAALEEQLALAAAAGSKAAVIFGNAHDPAALGSAPHDGAATGTAAAAGSHRPELRDRLAAIARDAGMALCGAGCMGFANASFGLRALGYTEPDPLPAGPVALVTHSGSVFSALLRARRGFGFTLAVSSGQELVTAAPAYLDYALTLPGTRVLGLVLEAIRDGGALRQVLGRAAERDVPVVLLTAGSSAAGQAMVAAHSGALAGSDGAWEALARAYGVHRVSDLAEFSDTLELFSAGRRVQPAAASSRDEARAAAGREDPGSIRTAAGPPPRTGIATVHDSGLERAHVADIAESAGLSFAEIGPATRARLAGLLDPGLIPANPLDVWGTGAETRDLFGGSLLALADDPAVEAVALAVDLVHELDGDDSYPLALLDVAAQTPKPLAVLSNLPSVIDADLASELRACGIPVLEGTRSGLLAMSHLLAHGQRQAARADGRFGDGSAGGGPDRTGPAMRAGQNGAAGQPEPGAAHRVEPGAAGRAEPGAADRRGRACRLLASGAAQGARLLELLAEYGIAIARVLPATDETSARAAADQIGYPVVLKTDEPHIEHKSDVSGVVLGVGDPAALAAAYGDLAGRLGPRVLICQTIPAGTELALGIVRDPELGPLIVVGAGGVLVELLADRAVALPPVTAGEAGQLVAGLRVARLLDGARGAGRADQAAVARAVAGLSQLALDLGDQLAALDINPLICGPDGAIAVDALAIPRYPRDLAADGR